MRFGTFMAPFHPVGQNPTLAIERDLDLIVHLDRWGFDEAWVGEHHSAGYEIIASPEVFIGVAAERTKQIRLGTGVSSLPYHHPLMLADRMVLLDHLTRGRTMLGVGPGQLTSDAHMLGIPADQQRPRMEEALDVMMALLRGETVTYECEWFTVRDARLQLRPYSDPCFDIAVAASFSPTGARAAGKHGIGMLSVAATARQGMDLLVAPLGPLGRARRRERARRPTASKWRLVGPMHLAETREQAEREVEYGIAQFSRYFTHVLPAGPVQGDTAGRDHREQQGVGLRGDRHARRRGRADRGADRGERRRLRRVPAVRPRLGAPAAKLRSYELFAQYVMPHFTGQLEPVAASCDWVTGSGGEFVGRAAQRDRQGHRGPRGRARRHRRADPPAVTAHASTRSSRPRACRSRSTTGAATATRCCSSHPTGFHGVGVAARRGAARRARAPGVVVRLPWPRRQRPVARRHLLVGRLRRRRAGGARPPRPARRRRACSRSATRRARRR